MKWASLYSTRRTGDTGPKQTSADEVRNAFQRDYDRIIFASPFRRLQNKTQVFPLPGAIFVHNRLTHSLEVASVGRSLGKAVGEKIAAGNPGEGESFTEFYRYQLPYVIASACLAHDIGNPPFGHSGEDAIRSYFTGLEGDERKLVHSRLTPAQLADLELFEGNSNALRILTHSFNQAGAGGYKLTYTTLAALVKYPSTSAEGFDKDSGLKATKKSGYFLSELDTYQEIARELDIPRKQGFEHVYARHPFVYLTEAADDICYRVIDLEDAHRLHITSYEVFSNMFLPFFDGEQEHYNSRAYLERKLQGLPDDNEKVQYIRARWIGLMVNKLSDLYMQYEDALLAGTLEHDLLKCLPPHDRELISKINDYSVKHIYNYKPVAEIEIAGYNVIGGLLAEFVHAVLHPGLSKSRKIFKLVPPQFALQLKDDSLYNDIQSLVDYISGMTDLFAIDLYRKITGISIPDIR